MYKLERVQFDKSSCETKRYLLGVYATCSCAAKAAEKITKIKPIINLSSTKECYYEVTNIVQVAEKQPYGEFKTYLEKIVEYGRINKLDDEQIYFVIVDYVREYFMTDEIDVYLNDEYFDLQMELAPDFSIGFVLNDYVNEIDFEDGIYEEDNVDFAELIECALAWYKGYVTKDMMDKFREEKKKVQNEYDDKDITNERV
jgi:hypothetical protein